jgi:hypothetical protein
MEVLDATTVAEWAVVRAESSAAPIVSLATEHEARLAAATASAAYITVATAAEGDNMPVMAVFPDYEGSGALAERALPPMEPWMGDILLAVASDPGTIAAAESEAHLLASPNSSGAQSALMRLPVAARSRNGDPLAYTAAVEHEGVVRLALFLTVPPGSFTATSIFAALYRAASPAADIGENDPRFLSDAELAGMQRPIPEIADADGMAGDSASDARWFWMLALILLAGEWIVRRRLSVTTPATEVP